MNQETALEVMKSGVNTFLTGPPGCGKTYTTNLFLDWAYDNGKKITVCASTGIAATHINGSTLHSYLGVRNDDVLDIDDLLQIINNSYTQKRLNGTDILVIDEVSMLSAQMIENMNQILQKVRSNSAIFGGVQIIFCR